MRIISLPDAKIKYAISANKVNEDTPINIDFEFGKSRTKSINFANKIISIKYTAGNVHMNEKTITDNNIAIATAHLTICDLYPKIVTAKKAKKQTK